MQVHRARHMQESQISKIVFPDIKSKAGKDYHKGNMEKLRQKEQDIQTKIEEEKNQPKKDPWKMKRFQSVDAKVSQYIKDPSKGNQQQDFPTNTNKVGEAQTKRQAPIQMEAKPQIKQNSPIQMEYQQNEKENHYQGLSMKGNTYDYQIGYKEPKTQKVQAHKDSENIFAMMNEEVNTRVVTYDRDDKLVLKKQNTQLQQRNDPISISDPNQGQMQRTKEPVPKASEVNKVQKRSEKNYVSDNVNKVIHEMQPKPVKIEEAAEGAPQVHKNFGKIPKYINKYKHDKEEIIKERKREEEEAKLPPGTRLMAEEERLKTLDELQVSKRELNNLLERMPLSNKTISMEKKRKELEEKLNRLERAIETFSKKTVYIAI